MDPRQQRTQQALQNALWQLLELHDFDDIRVTDLVEHADVALPTFYRNYENKVDLLTKTLYAIGQQLARDNAQVNLSIENLLHIDASTLPTLPFLRFVDDNFVVMRRLLTSPYNLLVFEAVLDITAAQIRRDTPEWEPHEVDLIVGSVVGCVYQWVLSDRKYSVEELAYMIYWTTTSGALALRGKLKPAQMASLIDNG
ncbi:MAG: hypothetical protein AAF653_16800 [Chloroflexota bacterium]